MEKTMTGKIWIWMGILAVAWPVAGWTQTLPLDEVLGKIQEQYEKNADFKADFGQEAVIKSLGKKQQAEGIVYFKKPGKMHWMYHKPTKQQIISDGKTLWNYQPENKQVIVTRVAQAFQSKTPSTFLAGLGNLKKDFQARFVKDPAPGSNYALELTPLETQGGVEKLFLLADPKSFHILQAKIQDAMGNTTQISFSKITFNNNLADSLFTFTAPKGVEVFTMPGASPAGGSEK
jgi:outer membrane lipoprotein carrier protein